MWDHDIMMCSLFAEKLKIVRVESRPRDKYIEFVHVANAADLGLPCQNTDEGYRMEINSSRQSVHIYGKYRKSTSFTVLCG